MLTSNKILTVIQDNDEVIRNFGIKKIGLFGSFAKATAKRDSDIDILIEFIPGSKTFDNYMDLKFFLENKLGKRIDLVIKNVLKSRIKPQIMKEVKYARL